MKKFLISLAIFSILSFPAFAFAQGLVPCGKEVYQFDVVENGVKHLKGELRQCDFNGLMTLIDNVTQFALFKLALPISAIMFFYAGFKLVTSGGSTEARTKAKSIFTSTVFGFIIALTAWLVVKTILLILGYQGAWIGL
mgnify:FL=1